MSFDLSAYDCKLIKFAELESVTLADLPQGASRFWSVGPTLRWPLFNAGRIRANIAVQDARTAHQLSAYEQTVLQALEEVENALVATVGSRRAASSSRTRWRQISRPWPWPMSSIAPASARF